jgi:hypothetical protein
MAAFPKTVFSPQRQEPVSLKVSFYYVFSEAAMSKLLVQALEKLAKSSDKLTFELKHCTLIEEHLEPILCVYPNAGKNKEVELVGQIFNFIDVLGGKEGLNTERKTIVNFLTLYRP